MHAKLVISTVICLTPMCAFSDRARAQVAEGVEEGDLFVGAASSPSPFATLGRYACEKFSTGMSMRS
jgi:hypothetical protein